jgi:hypothetical protein
MRIDLADNIKLGDVVYNCFMDELVVTSIYGKGSSKIIFSTIDTRLHRSNYNFSDLYLTDLEGESDDEKSWVNWAKDNRDFFNEFDHIETMKDLYKIGFCRGFENRQKITFEEAMQK